MSTRRMCVGYLKNEQRNPGEYPINMCAAEDGPGTNERGGRGDRGGGDINLNMYSV